MWRQCMVCYVQVPRGLVGSEADRSRSERIFDSTLSVALNASTSTSPPTTASSFPSAASSWARLGWSAADDMLDRESETATTSGGCAAGDDASE